MSCPPHWFHTFAKRSCRQVKLRASAAAPTPWLRGGEEGDPSSCMQPLHPRDPSGCGKRAQQPLTVAEGRMKSWKSGAAQRCDHGQARDAKCISRDRSATETKDMVLVCVLWIFSMAVGPWLSSCIGFPIHETGAVLLFHSRENARDRDGWVGIVCWKPTLIPPDPGDTRMTLLLAIRS